MKIPDSCSITAPHPTIIPQAIQHLDLETWQQAFGTLRPQNAIPGNIKDHGKNVGFLFRIEMSTYFKMN